MIKIGIICRELKLLVDGHKFSGHLKNVIVAPARFFYFPQRLCILLLKFALADFLRGLSSDTSMENLKCLGIIVPPTAGTGPFIAKAFLGWGIKSQPLCFKMDRP